MHDVHTITSSVWNVHVVDPIVCVHYRVFVIVTPC